MRAHSRVAPYRALLITSIVLAGTGCHPRLAQLRPIPQRAAAITADPVVFGLSAEESEVVDVVSTGEATVVFVASPCTQPCEGGDSSFLSRCELVDGDLRETHVVDLGPGELTSVAGHPSGRYAAGVLKHPRKPGTGPGSMVLVEGERVLATIQLGPGPDSIAMSPDGRFAVVACEAQPPDVEDCPDDTGADGEGSLIVVDLGDGPARPAIAAHVRGAAIFERFFRQHPDRASGPEAVEPEFIAISADSSLALATLQEQSAVVSLDLSLLRSRREAPPEEVGSRILAGAVLLPHDQRDPRGVVRGSHPDGVAISPDGSFALTANEAHPRARGLQGISLIDLRDGPGAMRVAATHALFDLDPTLKSAKEKAVKRIAKRKGPPKRVERLPRLDPEGVAVVDSGSLRLAALAIERASPLDDAGSVLLLDMTGALEGVTPRKIDRIAVGATPGARPETLDFSADGRWLVVASERDGGTLTVIDLGRQPEPAVGPPGPQPPGGAR